MLILLLIYHFVIRYHIEDISYFNSAKNIINQNIEEEKSFINISWSFSKNEMQKEINKINHSPLKAFWYSRILNFKKSNQINKELLAIIKSERIVKVWWYVKDISWKPIYWVKIKNLLTWNDYFTDEKWYFQFNQEFILPQQIPVLLEKEWYWNFVYTYFLKLNKYRWKKIIEPTINLKFSQVKEIIIEQWKNYDINFNNWAIKLNKDTLVFEWTDKNYYWPVKIYFSSYWKKEILKNHTLLNSLSFIAKKDRTDYDLLDEDKFITWVLEPFWLININLYSNSWEKLNIKKDYKAIINIPVDNQLRAIELFHLNKQDSKTYNWFWYLNTKLWVWENYIDWDYDFDNNIYKAQIPSFSNYTFSHYNDFHRDKPSISTKDKLLQNWINTVTITNNYTSNWKTKKYRENFINNWEYSSNNECEFYCDTITPIININNFYTDNTPPIWKITYSPTWWTNSEVKINVECIDYESWCKQDNYKENISTNKSGSIVIEDIAWNTTIIPYYVFNIDYKKSEISLFCDNNSKSYVTCIWSMSKKWDSKDTLKLSHYLSWSTLFDIPETNGQDIKHTYTKNWQYKIILEWYDESWNKAKSQTTNFTIDTSNPHITTKENFHKWYNNSSIKDFHFTINDQISSTNINENIWLEKLEAKINWKEIISNWFIKNADLSKNYITIPLESIYLNIQDNTHNTLSFKITDKQSNETNINYSISYDKTIPTWKIVYSTSWVTNWNIIVEIKCIDKESWCKQEIYRKVVNSNENWSIKIENNAWLINNINYEVTNIDSTAPTNLEILYNTWWTKKSQIITIKAQDLWWSNLKKLVLKEKIEWDNIWKEVKIWDNINLNELITKTWTKNIENSKPWNYEYQLIALDYAWNSNNIINNDLIKIDSKSPSIWYKIFWSTKELESDSWINEDVNIHIICSDYWWSWCDTSSYEYQASSLPFLSCNNSWSWNKWWSKEYLQHKNWNTTKYICFRWKDLTWNYAYSNVAIIKIDKQNPDIWYKMNQLSNSWTNKKVNISISCLDKPWSWCNKDSFQYKESDTTIICDDSGEWKYWWKINYKTNINKNIIKHVCFRWKDYTWNYSYSDVAIIKIDKQDPKIWYKMNITSNTWTNKNIITSISCIDNWSWCDTESYQYKISNYPITCNNSWIWNDWIKQNYNTDWIRYICFRWKDNVWNWYIYSSPIIINLDKTAPEKVEINYDSWWTNSTKNIEIKALDNLKLKKLELLNSNNLWKTWDIINTWDNLDSSELISKNIDIKVDNWNNYIYKLQAYDYAWNLSSIINTNPIKFDTDSPKISLNCENTSNLKVYCKSKIEKKWNALDYLKYKHSFNWKTISTINNNDIINYSYTENWSYNIELEWYDEAWNNTNKITKEFNINTSNPTIFSKNDFNKWYSYNSLENLSFKVKDQKFEIKLSIFCHCFCSSFSIFFSLSFISLFALFWE